MVDTIQSKSIFTSYQSERLQDIGNFLIRVCDPDIVLVALKLGFDTEELAEGQKEYSIAAGLNLNIQQLISSAVYDRLQVGGAATKAKLRQVDDFENRWYRRVRNALRRFVVADQRDAFVEAFFSDMPQQPEGPLAVDTVRKLVPRINQLADSSVPGAQNAHAALVKKGILTAIEYVSHLLKELDSQPNLTAPLAPVSEALRLGLAGSGGASKEEPETPATPTTPPTPDAPTPTS